MYKHGSASLQRSADKLKAPLEMRANVCIVRIIDGDTAVCRNTRATFVFEHIGEIIACIQHLISRAFAAHSCTKGSVCRFNLLSPPGQQLA